MKPLVCLAFATWIPLGGPPEDVGGPVGAVASGEESRPAPGRSEGHPSNLPADRQLRHAWVQHRLEGDLDRARSLYETILNDPGVAVDLRARAAIGLGLMERDLGREQEAAGQFSQVQRLAGVSPRWRGNARSLMTTVEGGKAGTPLLSDLNRRVDSLENELDQLTDLLRDREEELRRKEDLIDRLERRNEAQTVAEERCTEILRSKASRFADAIVNEDRELQYIRRYFIGQALYRAKSHFSEGRYLHAFNELKNVLEVEPNHREAQELSARCRRSLAVATKHRSGDVFSAPGTSADATRRPPKNDALRRVTNLRGRAVELMSAYLAEGKRFYAHGNNARAIESFQRLLEEYAWSPVALSEEEIETIVQPADRLLRRCLEESGSGETAFELLGQESQLLERLKATTDDLLDREEALAETDGNMERLRGGRIGLVTAGEECRRSLGEGVQALQRGESDAARRAFSDVLTLLDWFPALDPDGRIRRSVDGRLERLQESESRLGKG